MAKLEGPCDTVMKKHIRSAQDEEKQADNSREVLYVYLGMKLKDNIPIMGYIRWFSFRFRSKTRLCSM